MQRKTRLLLVAARLLEQEAKDWALDGREQSGEDAMYFGRRAKRLFGAAYSLREIAKDTTPTKKKRDLSAIAQHSSAISDSLKVSDGLIGVWETESYCH